MKYVSGPAAARIAASRIEWIGGGATVFSY
jgi:hypothetical protein